MTTTQNMAVWFCGDYSQFGRETDAAMLVQDAGSRRPIAWLPKSAARKITSREVNALVEKPVAETMLDNSMGVFVVAPLWLGDAKGLEYVGACK